MEPNQLNCIAECESCMPAWASVQYKRTLTINFCHLTFHRYTGSVLSLARSLPHILSKWFIFESWPPLFIVFSQFYDVVASHCLLLSCLENLSFFQFLLIALWLKEFSSNEFLSLSFSLSDCCNQFDSKVFFSTFVRVFFATRFNPVVSLKEKCRWKKMFRPFHFKVNTNARNCVHCVCVWVSSFHLTFHQFSEEPEFVVSFFLTRPKIECAWK